MSARLLIGVAGDLHSPLRVPSFGSARDTVTAVELESVSGFI